MFREPATTRSARASQCHVLAVSNRADPGRCQKRKAGNDDFALMDTSRVSRRRRRISSLLLTLPASFTLSFTLKFVVQVESDSIHRPRAIGLRLPAYMTLTELRAHSQSRPIQAVPPGIEPGSGG